MTGTADNGWALAIERHIAAPPEKVWHVMTERQAEWWCPKPWYVEIIEQDWRAGGRSAMVMKGPNGEEMPQEGVFLEVTPGVRFVSTDAFHAGWTPAEPFMVGIWEIAPDGDGTLYRARALHWTEEAMKSHADMGFEQGWNACTDQLQALCEGD